MANDLSKDIVSSGRGGRLGRQMTIALFVCWSGFATPTKADDAKTLLTTFKNEFIEITPGEGKFPAELKPSNGKEAVRFEHSFFIAKYEVPQNLYEAVMGNNPSRWKGPRNSAEMFDWNQAVQFCEKATALMRRHGLIDDDQAIRLPTEAEWEYCCRAGTTTVFSFGDDVSQLGDYAWYTGNAAGNDPPVGAKKPNPWGLYDVHGYLWEWCGDAAEESEHLVIRGGAWTSTAEECRSDSRKSVPRTAKGPDIGLRCVLSNVDK